ncbi:lipopolysaccharide transport system permease protein [Pseudobutyrivibrio ruminis]|uniref:Transport permease protein n=1 Tax=Pseudobutyrivibrio ruminis TaxID=46206 RepID=A0A1H7H651_9FIRM|nr:ABC transporter permease [Pseudobutyrivibrio ruminis]SEK45761.1 lipopolysaccharide transport system permease protein [Pseudobutyrivibrio ruminis]
MERELKFENIIKSDSYSISEEIRKLLKYIDLILLFTKRNIILRYKQTIIGPCWIILTPFITSIVYAVIFGGVAGIGTDGVPQLLFYMISNSVWTVFSSILTETSNTFVNNVALYGKVYFPRLCLPISTMLTSFINFAINIFLFAGVYVYYLIKGTNLAPNWQIIIMPIIIIEVGLMALGVGIIISSLTTRYRDLAIVVTFGVQLWMYLSPVVYPVSMTTGFAKRFIMINPMTMPMEIIRYSMFGIGSINYISAIWSVAFTVIVIIIGLKLFGKIEKTFVDTV